MRPSPPVDASGPPVLTALAMTAAGWLGLVPARAGAGDVHAFLAWLALVGAALGVLAGASRARTLLLLPPLLWLPAVLAANLRAGTAGLPAPYLAWVAVAGLYAAGSACGSLARSPAWRQAGLALLLAGGLAALPVGAGRLAEPWPPPLAARLLDLSPVVFVLECGGSDWMRHPGVYDAAGTASIGPDLRDAWTGRRAAPFLLLVAALAAAGARLWTARRAPGPAH